MYDTGTEDVYFFSRVSVLAMAMKKGWTGAKAWCMVKKA